MLGKLFISITFAVVYVHASELIPTEVRNVGVGSASMCARISSMAAAYVGGPLVSINRGSLKMADMKMTDGTIKIAGYQTMK